MVKKSTPAAAAAAPVSEPVPVNAAEKVSAPVKKSKPSKEAAPVVPPVVEPVVVPVVVPVVEPDVVPSVEPLVADSHSLEQLVEKYSDYQSKLQQLNSLVVSLRTDFKSIEKLWSRELKTAQKLSSKRKRKATNRAPSGFVKPTLISPELAKFLGKESGVEMARTDVTKEITKYIKKNSLQNKENGRNINPDEALATLLKWTSEQGPLSYFNLQKFMAPHFQKKEVA
jgi:hypothetical protein